MWVAMFSVLLMVSTAIAGCGRLVAAHNNAVKSPSVTTTTGPPPNPDGASYVVKFSTPLAFRDLGVRLLTLGSQDAPPAIVDGTLAQGSSLADRVASYFERQGLDPVRLIGLEVSFPTPPTPKAAIAAIVADGPLPDMNATHKRPNFGVHFVATSQTWEFDVWPANGEKQALASGIFDASTFRGPVRYQVERAGDLARVVLPDGTTVEVRDPRIGLWSGKWMAWELFQDGGNVPSARIKSWWATS
jgi:hypothetical protein